MMLYTKQRSADGTVKFAFTLDDGNIIESVIIPQKNKFCLCLSTQAGCGMGCSFCITAKAGFKRDLTVDEMLMQLKTMWKHIAPETPGSIVFMGMGEPLLNYSNVISAIKSINDRKGLNFAQHKITVSTAGIADRIVDFGNDCSAKLAISLNAPDDRRRGKIMPKGYDIADIIRACRRFPTTRRRLVMFEYILFNDFNDSLEDADRLAALLQGIPTLVNLIPFNEHPHCDLKATPMERILLFKQHLISKGIKTFVRESRGAEIGAACGMLAGRLYR